jgi:hypothetical protein
MLYQSLNKNAADRIAWALGNPRRYTECRYGAIQNPGWKVVDDVGNHMCDCRHSSSLHMSRGALTAAATARTGGVVEL